MSISNYTLYNFLKGNGFGPWMCYFCGRKVAYKYQDRSKYSLNVHHRDGDRTNNRPANLKPAHQACHTIHHWSGRKHSEESRRKMSESSMSQKSLAIAKQVDGYLERAPK